MQDTEPAARELERCIRTPGFHRFMMNGFSQVGSDRIVHAVDYPFESFEDAFRWFDNCESGELDRRRIENAPRPFELP
jgi:gamma-resorcylate decarboxylase